MTNKRSRNDQSPRTQPIDYNNLTSQEIDDIFDQVPRNPVENVLHHQIPSITGVIDDVLTGDFIDLTGDDEFTANDGVITCGENEKENTGENEDKPATVAVKKYSRLKSCACGCGAYSRAAGVQQTRAVKCLDREHGDAWNLKNPEEKRMLRTPGNTDALTASNAHRARMHAHVNKSRSAVDHESSVNSRRKRIETENHSFVETENRPFIETENHSFIETALQF